MNVVSNFVSCLHASSYLYYVTWDVLNCGTIFFKETWDTFWKTLNHELGGMWMWYWYHESLDTNRVVRQFILWDFDEVYDLRGPHRICLEALARQEYMTCCAIVLTPPYYHALHHITFLHLHDIYTYNLSYVMILSAFMLWVYFIHVVLYKFIALMLD